MNLLGITEFKKNSRLLLHCCLTSGTYYKHYGHSSVFWLLLFPHYSNLTTFSYFSAFYVYLGQNKATRLFLLISEYLNYHALLLSRLSKSDLIFQVKRRVNSKAELKHFWSQTGLAAFQWLQIFNTYTIGLFDFKWKNVKTMVLWIPDL